MNKTTLVIMAAGMGSRYGGIKQADAFGPKGEWLMDYSIFDAQVAGFYNVVIITRKELLNDMQTHAEKIWANKIPISFVLQEKPVNSNLERTKPYGTGQAILATKDVVKNPFAVINADDFYGREAYIAMHQFLSNIKTDEAIFSLVGYPVMETLSDIGSVSRGICTLNDKNELIEINEMTKISIQNNILQNENDDNTSTKIPENSFASMNFWGFSTFLFDELENEWNTFFANHGNELKSEFLIPTVVSNLLKAKKIKVQLLADGKGWCGVTYSEEKEAVINILKDKIKAGIYPEKL